MSSSFKTFLKHTAKDFHNQSVNPPVVRASTIIFKSMKDIRKTQAKAQKNPIGGHYDYARQGTSTTYILQQMLKRMEDYTIYFQKYQITQSRCCQLSYVLNYKYLLICLDILSSPLQYLMLKNPKRFCYNRLFVKNMS